MHRRQVLRAGSAAGLAVAGGCTAFRTPSNGSSDDGDPAGDGGLDRIEAYEPLGSIRIDPAMEAVVDDDGRTAYVAVGDGFVTVDVSDPAEPTILDELHDVLGEEDLELTGVHDVDVDGDRLAVVGPANPTGGDVFEGLALFDVSDPADPVRIGDPFDTGEHVHNGFVDGDFVYLVVNDGVDNPLVIVDASDDEPEEVGRWSVREHEPGWGDVPWQAWYAHDVFVQDEVAVLANWNAGTYLLDVADPTDPTYITHVRDPGVDLDAQRSVDEADRDDARTLQTALPGNDHYSALDESRDLLAVGREAWASDPDDTDAIGGIDLYEVSDPNDPRRLATIDPPESPDATYGGTWTTAHNFELRDGHLYSSWYQGGVKIHDLADPAAPAELAWWRDPATAAFWTARVAESGSFFVASSTPILPGSDTDGGLYTFPIAAGTQVDPPPMTDADG